MAKHCIYFLFILLTALSCTEEPKPDHLVPNPDKPPGELPPPSPPDKTPPKYLGMDYVYDTILLKFNEPVKPIYLYNNGEDSSRFQYSTEIKIFNRRPCLPCITPVGFKVVDKGKNILEGSDTMRFHDAKIKYNGFISTSYIDAKEEFAYLMIGISNEKPRFQILSLVEKKMVENSFIVFDSLLRSSRGYLMAHNPLDGYFYLYASVSSTIHVWSASEYKFIRKITITEPAGQGNFLYPVKLEFTTSGKGLLIVQKYNDWADSGDTKVKIIDTNNGDALTHLPDFDDQQLRILFPSPDESKIYFGCRDRATYNSLIGVLNSNGNLSFIPLSVSNFGIPNLLIPNKKNNTMLVRLNGMFIKDLDTGIETPRAYNGGYYDHSYAPGEINFAYTYNYYNDAFALLDYNQAFTVFKHEPTFDADGIISLTNNKNLIVWGNNEIYFLMIDRLRKQHF